MFTTEAAPDAVSDQILDDLRARLRAFRRVVLHPPTRGHLELIPPISMI